jgi:hypothetical protein
MDTSIPQIPSIIVPPFSKMFNLFHYHIFKNTCNVTTWCYCTSGAALWNLRKITNPNQHILIIQESLVPLWCISIHLCILRIFYSKIRPCYAYHFVTSFLSNDVHLPIWLNCRLMKYSQKLHSYDFYREFTQYPSRTTELGFMSSK